MTFLRDDLIDHLIDHQRRHPEMNWPVEIRDRWLVKAPQGIEHCDIDRVVILRGEPAISLIHPAQRP